MGIVSLVGTLAIATYPEYRLQTLADAAWDSVHAGDPAGILREHALARDAELETWRDHSRTSPWGLVVLSLVTTPLLLLAARLRWKSGEELLRSDPRPPVLYLRPFDQDLRDMAFSVPERKVMKWLRSIGPVIAAGRPGERLPPLGAARIYLPDAGWESAVAALADRARLIVAGAGTTPGVLWELQYLRAHVPPEKVALLVPPHTGDLAAAEKALGVALPPTAGPLVTFDADWKPHPARKHTLESAIRALCYRLPLASAGEGGDRVRQPVPSLEVRFRPYPPFRLPWWIMLTPLASFSALTVLPPDDLGVGRILEMLLVLSLALAAAFVPWIGGAAVSRSATAFAMVMFLHAASIGYRAVLRSINARMQQRAEALAMERYRAGAANVAALEDSVELALRPAASTPGAYSLTRGELRASIAAIAELDRRLATLAKARSRFAADTVTLANVDGTGTGLEADAIRGREAVFAQRRSCGVALAGLDFLSSRWGRWTTVPRAGGLRFSDPRDRVRYDTLTAPVAWADMVDHTRRRSFQVLLAQGDTFVVPVASSRCCLAPATSRIDVCLGSMPVIRRPSPGGSGSVDRVNP